MRGEPSEHLVAQTSETTGANGTVKLVAGTQAPPVDLTTRGTPRRRAPKGTFDRKAYQREKARERRAKLKGNPDAV